MKQDEYVRHDGLGLAALVARGEVTAGELLETAIARLEAVNPRLNAVITPMFDIARERASEQLTGAFAGVPFLLKDLFQDYAGVPTAYGCNALKKAGWRPPHHAEVVRRFIDAGVICMGKTNTPEFGAKGVTEPGAFGAARNPWDTDRTPGGSSGGSAAAVAAGVAPMAGANDGGGSIRIPAACCGLFGLKPGRGRTPTGPDFTEMMHGASVEHILSRSVRDSAAMLDAISGYEPGASFRLAPPEVPYLKAIEDAPRKLRIGLMTRSPLGTDVHPQAVQAAEHAAKALEALGHHVEHAEPAIDGMRLAKDWLLMWFVHMAAAVDRIQADFGAATNDFELDTRAMAHIGKAMSASDYLDGYNRWKDYRHALAAFHAQYDLLLTPTMAHPPVPVGATETPRWQQAALRGLLRLPTGRALLKSGIVDQMAQESLKYVPFTQMANLTGVPAMSVPLYQTPDNLPMGTQFVGAPGSEALLLQLAAQLEAAAPWFGRRPELWRYPRFPPACRADWRRLFTTCSCWSGCGSCRYSRCCPFSAARPSTAAAPGCGSTCCSCPICFSPGSGPTAARHWACAPGACNCAAPTVPPWAGDKHCCATSRRGSRGCRLSVSSGVCSTARSAVGKTFSAIPSWWCSRGSDSLSHPRVNR